MSDSVTSRLYDTASSLVGRVISSTTGSGSGSGLSGVQSLPPLPKDDDFTTVKACDLMAVAHALAAVGESIEMPRLCVVGSQSAGKSSVLNALVGVDILPTGGQMVTRCPLNLNLTPTFGRGDGGDGDFSGSSSSNSSSGSTGGNGGGNSGNGNGGNGGEVVTVEFGDYAPGGGWCPEATFTLGYPKPTPEELAPVRRHIEAVTVRLAGEGKNISARPINVVIRAPGVTPLAVTDLPGLTMHALTDMGQPSDIKQRIQAVVKGAIEGERTLIVCVMAAREDLEADAAMEVVKAVDPSGDRTVGVLTKIDLMNEGTSVAPYLQGTMSRALGFGMGYFAVRCRGPKESHLTVKEGMAAEDAYFSGHRVYARLRTRCGAKNLAVRLGDALARKIRETLPDVLGDVSARLEASRAELASMGLDTPTDAAAMAAFANSIVESFSRQFAEALDPRRSVPSFSSRDSSRMLDTGRGPMSSKSDHHNTSSSSSSSIDGEKTGTAAENGTGGRKKGFSKPGSVSHPSSVGRSIRNLLCAFREECAEFTPFDASHFDDEAVGRTLEECTGNRLDILVNPVDLIEHAMVGGGWSAEAAHGNHGPVLALSRPARRLVSELCSLLTSLAQRIIDGGPMRRFPELRRLVKESVLSQAIRTASEKASEAIEGFLEAEEGYIWTEDETFKREVRRLVLGEAESGGSSTSIGYSRPDAVRGILEAYFSQVRFSVQNAVPKLVMRFLVAGTERAVTRGVFAAVPRDPKALRALLREEGEAAERRMRLRDEVGSLEAALATLNGAATR